MAGEHRLSGRDLETMTAVCAVCGPVRVASRGRGRWVCANRKAEREASRSPAAARPGAGGPVTGWGLWRPGLPPAPPVAR